MKVAILSESEADRAAVHIFVSALLDQPTELYVRPFRTRGWPAVLQQIPVVLKELHYKANDVDALAIIADSDEDPPHLPEHDDPGPPNSACRLCRLRQAVALARTRLDPTGQTPVKIAIGLAIPSIEAWFRCGRDRSVTEAAWLVALRERRFAYDRRSLKVAVYGDERVKIGRMVEEATRLAADLTALETWFPNGFGPFAADVRGWLT